MSNNQHDHENFLSESDDQSSINFDEFMQEYLSAKEIVDSLQRCTRCVLPETFPFITFDEDGVCNFCHNYQKKELLGMDALEELLDRHRDADGTLKCVVSFSGGRDSSYGLHLVKKVLNMDPVAFTYDWGVATDIAQRNQVRMCEKLGVEQIKITANLDRKRANIKANLKAWLKKPDLGTIPVLTSVGQQFFYHANQVGKRLGRELIVLCATPFEHTYFKMGFSGIRPFAKLTMSEKMGLAFKYFQKYTGNPAYINRSVFDTLGGYLSFYIVPHNYLRLFEYLPWDENEVNSTLINEYDWEISDETPSTWRIDDGTVPLSDYMYYMMSGLTINDTFRSNQIREGLISREEALAILEVENRPRFKAIAWYCKKVGVDFTPTIQTINNSPRLYMK
jgi:glutamine---fructose-6-phosphate transaminase (isomerizing)